MHYPVSGDHRTDAPVALIFADSERGSAAASAAVEAAGGRVGARLALGDVGGRLAHQASVGALLLEVESDHGQMLDAALDRIDILSSRENVPIIVSIPPELIDTVSARITAPNSYLLCQPDTAERVVALSTAWVEQPTMVQEMPAEMDGVRLRRLADEVTRIARALASLSGGSNAPAGTLSGALQSQVKEMQGGFAAEPMGLFSTAMPEAAEIRSLLRLRRMRDNFFDPVLFADPAWDMLLDLMAAQLEGDHVAVSSLCIAASVPPTTALRWIKAMTDHKLFERHADPTDGRRIFIRLSDAAANSMARYFEASKRLGGMVV